MTELNAVIKTIAADPKLYLVWDTAGDSAAPKKIHAEGYATAAHVFAARELPMPSEDADAASSGATVVVALRDGSAPSRRYHISLRIEVMADDDV